MRKSVINIFVALTLLSLGLALVPTVLSQTTNIKIVSYSYYVDNFGSLDVVGEVQNVGPNTVTQVVLTGFIYSSDGTEQAYSYAQIGIENFPVTYLNPGQKAPFYMSFFEPNNPQGASWYSVDISEVKLTIVNANATSNYQYPDLTITSDSHHIGTNSIGNNADLGVYWVTGTIKNTGSQTAQNVTVFGTFYNNTGSVVAVGHSFNTVGNVSASGTASFKLGAFDLNQTIVSSSEKIDHYSLLITALGPILQGTPPIVTPYPSSGGSETQSPTDSLQPSGSTGTNKSNNSLNPTLIAIIVVIGVLVALGAIIALRKRKPQETKKVTHEKVIPRRKTTRRNR